MSEDKYAGTSNVLNAPSQQFAVITPDDANDVALVPKAIHISTTGGSPPTVGQVQLRGRDPAETPVVFDVIVGHTYHLRPYRVYAANLTAGLVIVGLY